MTTARDSHIIKEDIWQNGFEKRLLRHGLTLVDIRHGLTQIYTVYNSFLCVLYVLCG